MIPADREAAGPDPWAFLQAHTAARIAQGRTGHSLPTRALLAFQLDHARARDAVWTPLDSETLCAELAHCRPDPVVLQSQAVDRITYLQRPDLGRCLSPASLSQLETMPVSEPPTLAIVVADGLSATAVQRHAGPVVAGVVAGAANRNWVVAPIAVVQQGRVAIGDPIGHALGARLLLVLIGERPGLSSPDSLGAYLTYQPRPGLTDADRNCVSNIRPEGMPYGAAIDKLLYLLGEMHAHQLSGVALKDDMPVPTAGHTFSPASSAQTPETPD